MTKTETIQTAHGAVEYVKTTCDVCEQEVAEEQTKDFVIGEITREQDRRGDRNVIMEKDTHIRGKVCPYCRENPPMFPSPPEFDTGEIVVMISVVGIVLILIVPILLGLL
jgi:hypothetical protein